MVDEFAGPRKIRYFLYLLLFVFFGAVISTILADFYGITFLEPMMWWFVENPMALFELAGFFSIIALMAMVGMKALELADDSGF
ncbi:hypothetical protein HLRTI_002291 [Halorhabdus tiamatea SARL4B]|uniref:Uncharacterized protein n=1 Tax=Halorhabdus tiamatea SARL4B TaxID=1033806 RepID=F7PQU7_9EURY|nr:hypothetical protein [Halorhabdus tiamatea]ERJ05669.1 hypothetical protein HLRTI_002291 [Halorhabdus tiamatea SARL4B]CCQ35167.1 hypothetical protein HTIA_p3065 [Halorhabdus tiamatea SARL4B]